MKHDWQELTRLTKGEEIIVERARLVKKGIAIEGEFELPALSRLTIEDQMFVIAFIRCHGSIKEMEALFGISYPTVKNRLNRIAQTLEFVEINPQLFKNKTLELYSDSFTLVNQVNNKMYCSKDLEPFRNMALLMKKKIPYSLNLIPESDNPAQQAMGIS